MFNLIARFVFRRRLLILVGSGALLLASIGVLIHGGKLTTGIIEGTEAGRAQDLVAKIPAASNDSTLAVLFGSKDWMNTDPTFIRAMAESLNRIKRDPQIESIASPLEGPPALVARLRSPDSRHALAVLHLKGDLRDAAAALPGIRNALLPSPLTLHVTGKAAFTRNLDELLEKDLLRAELVSFPLALLVLLMVFRTWAAAALPLAVGALAVTAGVSGVLVLSRFTPMAQYTLNVVSLIGLGVAIDYSLFIVSRFRLELQKGVTVETALIRTLDTAGRAVAFSGLAVGVGLAGLLFYPRSYLSAMGIAGALVVFFAVGCALTFLPAMLALLGERINWGRVPLPAFADRPGLWHGISTWVMRHPVWVLVPTLGILILLGSPFLRLKMAATDITALPPTSEARQGAEELARAFPAQTATRIVVAVEFPNGSAFTPERAGALFDASRTIAQLPDVLGVESIVDLDPSVKRRTYVGLAGAAESELPPEFDLAKQNFISGSITALTVITSALPGSDRARNLVRDLRAHRNLADGTLWVGGQTAYDIDSMTFVREHSSRAMAFVVITTGLVLFLLLGSVVLPLKALLMNFLSIAGSFGALVWIFQEGHLRSLLHFEPGPIEPSLPILLFCTLFGLSMDYEVLLLSRIHEEYLRTGDNTHAVAEGLEQTGGLITSAAAIMVAVFAAFGLATVVVVKAMGLGMAVAVVLDATLVRVLIVPATMRLFGDFNWWSPRFLRRLFETAQGR